ncbi:hypothetical protein AB0H71_07605 [Nocardia sp. NPDC050697]|uniref:hypothetical protein n=1 Tax=Nocardia sp. NPDC050697 TaxID=3155158 RepID=UPI0033C7D043
MRTSLRLTAASVAAAALVATASGALAQPLEPAPAPVAESYSTGSSGADHAGDALRTGQYLVQQGNVIGVLVLLVTTPFKIFTSGVCDLAAGSSLPNPCVPNVW